jgi:hypothetical protein
MNSQQQLAEQYVAEGRAIVAPALKGSDLSVLIDKLVAWAQTVEFSQIGREAAHVVLHFVMDELYPRALEWGPTWLDMVLSLVVLPLLKKWDESFHPTP